MHLMKAIFPNLPFLAFLQSQFDNASQFDKTLTYIFCPLTQHHDRSTTEI